MVVAGLRHTPLNSTPTSNRRRSGNIVIIQSGIGPTKVELCIQSLQSMTVHRLWLLGVCGGLSDNLNPGDLVLANASIDRTHDDTSGSIEIPIDAAVREQIAQAANQIGCRLIAGPVITTPSPLIRRADKLEASKSGAIAVEMEAGPFAFWTASRAIPFIHLRIVMDPADDSPIMAGEHWEFLKGRMRIRAFRQMLIASRTLRRITLALAQKGGPFE